MIRINLTNSHSISHKANENIPNNSNESPSEKKGEKSMLIGALVGLAAIGATAIGLKKTSPISYEEALKKAGIQIKDDIAVLIESGEKFTGKIERFENRNKKETIEFVDGLITEKLYHNLFGKELEGIFYKNGKEVLNIKRALSQTGNKGFTYSGKDIPPTKPAAFVATDQGFAWAREFLKKQK